MVAVAGMDASLLSAEATRCSGAFIRLVGNTARLSLLPFHLQGRISSPRLGFGTLSTDEQEALFGQAVLQPEH